MRAFVAVRQLASALPVNDITRLQDEIKELKEYVEAAFADYNDINEDTRMQLELINQAIAELQAKDKQADAFLHLGQADPALQHMQPLGHIPIFHNGARDQLGEHGDEGAEVHHVALDRCVLPVHVDGIAHGLEGVEGDTDGQQQPQRLDGCAQQTVQVADGKIRVLEKAQDRQGSHHRDDQHRLGAARPPPAPKVADGQTVAVVEHRGEQHDQNVLRLTPAVKQQAGDKQ